MQAFWLGVTKAGHINYCGSLLPEEGWRGVPDGVVGAATSSRSQGMEMVQSSSTLSEVWVQRAFVVVAMFLATSTHAQNKAAEQAELEAAKKVAARALADFSTTLDLRRVHRDLYVKTPSMRRSIMCAGLYEAGVDPKVADQLGTAALERAFLAAENLSWLIWSYAYQEGKDVRLEDFVSSIRPRVWPKLNKRQRNMFQRLWKSSDDEPANSEKISKRELSDWVSLTEILAAELRRIIPAELRQRFSNSAEIEAFPKAASDVLDLKNRKTYYVSAVVKGIWGKYTFGIVREKGAMRIFSFITHDGPG